MDNGIQAYVDDVLSRITADERTKARLREDLVSHIESAAEDADARDVLRRMGDAESMARDLSDTLYDDKARVIGELVRARAEIRHMSGYEYKSQSTLFGLPLVHVNLTRNYRPRGAGVRVAKGILAIGDVSIGVVSMGGVALGGICFGGVSLGLFSFAGLAIGLLLAIGGGAVGMFALGGLAVGLYSFGGIAVAARIAVGGIAHATVAIGGDAAGPYAISIGGSSLSTALVTRQEVRDLIRTAYPTLETWIVELFAGIFS